MINWRQFLLRMSGLILGAALALWLGGWSPRVSANVTLVSFTATSLPGQPEVYIEWATATQFSTVGFFLVRSNAANDTYTRVSEFQPREGDDLTGWEYEWTDEDTTLSQTYWYKLEEITSSGNSEFYGPVSVVAGVLATAEPPVSPALTPTATPTSTPLPTATPTTQSGPAAVGPSPSTESVVAATPRPVTGATVTPRPNSPGSSFSPTEAPLPATPFSSDEPLPQPADPSVSVEPNTAAEPAAPSSPAGSELAPAPAPAPVVESADEAVVMAAPVVVVTETASAAISSGPSSTPALLLIAAAFLFLGMAFIILRQIHP